MSSLSTGGLLSESRAGGAGDFAHPVFLGPVVDFGIGGERFQHPETVRKVGAASGFGARIVEVAEVYGAGGAGFDAGRDVIRGVDCGHAVGDGLGLGGMPAAVAEVALFDDAAHAGSDVGVEGFFHAGGPGGIPPVEVACVVGAGGHAVAATEAALGHLADDPGGGVDIHRLLWADADAGGILAAVLAEDGDEGGAAVGAFGTVIDLEDADPGEAGAIGSGSGGGGDVVLNGAGNHAGAATVAAVDVDGHAVAGRRSLLVFGDHTLTTLAREEGPHTSWIPGDAPTSTAPGGTAGSTVTSTAHLPIRVCRMARAPLDRLAECASEGLSATRLGARRRFDSW